MRQESAAETQKSTYAYPNFKPACGTNELECCFLESVADGILFWDTIVFETSVVRTGVQKSTCSPMGGAGGDERIE